MTRTARLSSLVLSAFLFTPFLLAVFSQAAQIVS